MEFYTDIQIEISGVSKSQSAEAILERKSIGLFYFKKPLSALSD
ncbi:MAG: hypothetical protein R2830_27405 [Saprospiraceae bacterium]